VKINPIDLPLLPKVVKYARVIDFGQYQARGYNSSSISSIIVIDIDSLIKYQNNWIPLDGADKSGRRIEFLDSSRGLVCSIYICSKAALNNYGVKNMELQIQWGK
jgi:hypothetical protein